MIEVIGNKTKDNLYSFVSEAKKEIFYVLLLLKSQS